MKPTIKKAALAVVLGVLVASFAPGLVSAKVTKYTFNDVILTEADGSEIQGEIEAGVKEVNKGSSVNCTYFTDDYQESLGYYFEHVDEAPMTAEDVLAFCVEEFPNRFT